MSADGQVEEDSARYSKAVSNQHLSSRFSIMIMSEDGQVEEDSARYSKAVSNQQ
ncbi:hypothetical protein J6590_029186 [Homalodisca vitripennis]|nr:hypothetical protein J6590_029186 [Homalodisca vitripennis]